MDFLDSLLKGTGGGQREAGGLGGLVSMVSKNPQIIGALAGLLSTRDTSVGGNAGLGGLIAAFQKKGLGDLVSSWVSCGPNPPVTASQLSEVLGQDTIGQFANRAGMPASQAGSILAALLPAAIDRLTPDGKVPETDALESSLSSLLAKLGH